MEENFIITEQNIIKTYDERQQEQCKLYKQYLQIKQENPTFGYKRIAKLMGEKIGKTRWWHQGKHKPVPIQTVEWLTEKNLLPLTKNNQKLPLIARILGATFGDGGIFATLNAIFLSSKELDATKMFKYDLLQIFGNEIEQNMILREGGEYGHSWCQWNTNRNVIRFFVALGAPQGKKKERGPFMPSWIFLEQEIADEFFGAFLGGEIGIPKIHVSGTYLDSCAVGITSKPEFKQQTETFLNEVRRYLTTRSIRTGKISIAFNKKDKTCLILKLLIATDLENMLNLLTQIEIHYCIYKQKKLIDTLQEFSRIKLQRYRDLGKMGYGHQARLNLLRINEAVFYIIQYEQNLDHLYTMHPIEWLQDPKSISSQIIKNIACT